MKVLRCDRCAAETPGHLATSSWSVVVIKPGAPPQVPYAFGNQNAANNAVAGMMLTPPMSGPDLCPVCVTALREWLRPLPKVTGPA